MDGNFCIIGTRGVLSRPTGHKGNFNEQWADLIGD